ncbi:MAG: hypothetical protein IPN03_01535 [Holophagales bacterium]|nr:hypothetical protein [Holophagales bacterium]
MRRHLLVALMALACSAYAEAELVVLEEGRHLKVTAYELVGDERIRLTLYGGGELVLPMERVERIVDDEIDPKDYFSPPVEAVRPSGAAEVDPDPRWPEALRPR